MLIIEPLHIRLDTISLSGYHSITTRSAIVVLDFRATKPLVFPVEFNAALQLVTVQLTNARTRPDCREFRCRQSRARTTPDDPWTPELSRARGPPRRKATQRLALELVLLCASRPNVRRSTVLPEDTPRRCHVLRY